MTRQEAVWHANHVFNIVIERCINAQNLKEAREFDEAKQIVIEALEHDKKEIINTKSVFNLSDDLISRQAAIDALAKEMPSLTTPDGSGEFDHDIQITDEAFVDCMQIINELPSAQPKRPTAHWKDGKWCSNCGEGIPTDVWNGGVEKDEIKFCFSCGARMESDTDGSN